MNCERWQTVSNTGCLNCNYYITNIITPGEINIVYPPHIGCWATKTLHYNPIRGKEYIPDPCDILNKNGECSIFSPKIILPPYPPPLSWWDKIKVDLWYKINLFIGRYKL